MSGSNALLAAMPRQNYLMAADPVSELWASLPEYGGGNSVRAPALTNPGVNVRPVEYIAGQPVRPGYRNELIQLANLASGFAGTSINAVPVPGIRAFHGSPHRFDRFDMGKIGTGEGAQAYGHGLYFAGNEGVARSYREMLARPSIPAEQMAAFRARDPEVAALFERNLQQFGNPLHAYHATENALPFPATTHAQRELVYDMREAARSAPATGHMYEVNIRTSPDRLLDWDAPLSQQPQAVREALGRVPWADAYAGTSMPGGQIAPRTVEGVQQLRDAGIDGIRYLDAGSRAVGEGSRNYVMFDDKLIDIIRRYGIVPPALWGASQAGDGTQ